MRRDHHSRQRPVESQRVHHSTSIADCAREGVTAAKIGGRAIGGSVAGAVTSAVPVRARIAALVARVTGWGVLGAYRLSHNRRRGTRPTPTAATAAGAAEDQDQRTQRESIPFHRSASRGGRDSPSVGPSGEGRPEPPLANREGETRHWGGTKLQAVQPYSAQRDVQTQRVFFGNIFWDRTWNNRCHWATGNLRYIPPLAALENRLCPVGPNRL
jgi:hypothetical protein